jgi:hypothetical protein
MLVVDPSTNNRYSRVYSQNHGQSVGLSWCWAPSRAHDQICIYFGESYSPVNWGALSDERSGLFLASQSFVVSHLSVFTKLINNLRTIFTRPLSGQSQYSRLCHISSSFRYNGSLVTWTVVCLTAAKFKPLLFPRAYKFQVWSTYVHEYLGESLIKLHRYLQKQIFPFIILHLRDFGFKQLKTMPLSNLDHFSSRFNIILPLVTGNMTDNCAALKTIEAARSDIINSEIK